MANAKPSRIGEDGVSNSAPSDSDVTPEKKVTPSETPAKKARTRTVGNVKREVVRSVRDADGVIWDYVKIPSVSPGKPGEPEKEVDLIHRLRRPGSQRRPKSQEVEIEE